MPAPLSLLLTAMLVSLGAFVLLVLAGRKMGTTLCGILGTLAAITSFSMALITLMNWLNGGAVSAMQWGAGQGPVSITWGWAEGIRVGLYADSLTVLVTTAGMLVSTAVHLFTTGYLRHDVRGPRVFALLSLANAALIGLMTSPSLLQWAAWTSVLSVAAYLIAVPVPLGPGGLGITPIPRGLTGGDLAQRAASSLASLVMRSAGDAALFVACVLLAIAAPSLTWDAIWSVNRVDAHVGWLIVLAAVCQASAIPVSLFLPEAKGSPTPAAGLAYAATLLPAGVLLLVRCFPALQVTHLAALSLIGGLTLLTSALFALAESDLRRWLAWVTAAGVGAMFAAVGAGSPGAALLHLIASMFGIAVLALASGSVLHACLGERRVSHYGGLLFRMPASALLLAHGGATLVGAPLLAGSSSWNVILFHAWLSSGAGEPRGAISLLSLLLGLLLLSAAIARAWALVMTGRPRDREVYAAARESATLSVPVAILALIATVSGIALVSPVQQLVAVLPQEMRAAVEARGGTDDREVWRGGERWRPVPGPVLRPPPAPEADGPTGEFTANEPTSDEVSSERAIAPELPIPRWMDPIRWGVALLGAITGLAVPWVLWRGTEPRQRARELLARAFHLPRLILRGSELTLRLAGVLTLGAERLAIEPALNLAGRIALPIFHLPPKHAPGRRPHVAGRGRMLILILLVALLMTVAAAWAIVRRWEADTGGLA